MKKFTPDLPSEGKLTFHPFSQFRCSSINQNGRDSQILQMSKCMVIAARTRLKITFPSSADFLNFRKAWKWNTESVRPLPLFENHKRNKLEQSDILRKIINDPIPSCFHYERLFIIDNRFFRIDIPRLFHRYFKEYLETSVTAALITFHNLC